MTGARYPSLEEMKAKIEARIRELGSLVKSTRELTSEGGSSITEARGVVAYALGLGDGSGRPIDAGEPSKTVQHQYTAFSDSCDNLLMEALKDLYQAKLRIEGMIGVRDDAIAQAKTRAARAGQPA